MLDITDEGSGIFSFSVQLDGDADTIRGEIMAELLRNNVNILEIYTERPNLESVFIELINRPVQKHSLQELLDEMGGEAADEDDTTDDTKEEN